MIVFACTFITIAVVSTTIILFLKKKQCTLAFSPLAWLLVLGGTIHALLTLIPAGNWIETLAEPTSPILWLAAFLIYVCVPTIRTAFGRTEPFFPWHREITYTFTGRRFVLALPFVAITLAGMMGATAWGIRGIEAARAWSAGQQAITAKQGTVAYEQVTRAVTAHPYHSMYRIGLSKLSLALAIELASTGSQTPEDLSKAAALVEQAIREAKRATELNPKSVDAWTNAGQIYEQLTPYSPDAQSWADAAYAKAKSLKK